MTQAAIFRSEGEAARRAGSGIGACPYRHPRAARSWYAGWNAADGQIRALASCTADVAALFRTYDAGMWMIDRLGGVEFLADQQFAAGDQFAPQFNASTWRHMDLGYLGYII